MLVVTLFARLIAPVVAATTILSYNKIQNGHSSTQFTQVVLEKWLLNENHHPVES